MVFGYSARTKKIEKWHMTDKKQWTKSSCHYFCRMIRSMYSYRNTIDEPLIKCRTEKNNKIIGSYVSVTVAMSFKRRLKKRKKLATVCIACGRTKYLTEWNAFKALVRNTYTVNSTYLNLNIIFILLLHFDTHSIHKHMKPFLDTNININNIQES